MESGLEKSPTSRTSKITSAKGARVTFGPGQGLTGRMLLDLREGFGCILAGSFFPTTPSTERQSLIRWYLNESAYGVDQPVAQIWITDAHDLVLGVGKGTVAIKSEKLTPFFGKAMSIIAMASPHSEGSYLLELEVSGVLFASEVVSFDSRTCPATDFVVWGLSAATFEIAEMLITKPLGREDRENLVEYLDSKAAESVRAYSHRDFQTSSPPTYSPAGSPLAAFPTRAVIDTNILLDASLISDGFGTKALTALRDAKVSLFVDEISYQDAVRILRRHHHRTALPFENLERLLIECSRRHTILSVPPGDSLSGSRVKRQDLHLARISKTLDAFVVTDDVPLRHQLFSSGIPAAMSRELAVLTFGGEPPPAPYVLGGLLLGRQSSFVFARCVASPAIFNDGRTEATLWEWEDVGRFFYDLRRQAFVFAAAWGPELTHSFKITPGREIVLATSFAIQPSRTMIGIRVEFFDGGALVPFESRSVGSSESFRGHPSAHFGQRGITIANARVRTKGLPNGWPGSITGMTWGPGKIDAAAWKTFRAVKGTAPNPFTSNVVGVAVSLLHQDENLIQLPRFHDILAQVATATLWDMPR